jgi:hypothetical protein
MVHRNPAGRPDDGVSMRLDGDPAFRLQPEHGSSAWITFL